MIERISDLPLTVVGFRAAGEVTKDDYENVVFPAISKYLKAGTKLNYVFVIETALTNFSIGAWVQDAWLGLKEIAKWRRVAIVSNIEGVRSFTNKASHFLPGEYKGFSLAEEEDAILWAAG